MQTVDWGKQHLKKFPIHIIHNQWRRQDLVSGGTTIEAPKAPSGVEYGEGCPLPSRLLGLGERRELPSGVRGRAPAAIAFSAYFRPQNASSSKKNTILLSKV